MVKDMINCRSGRAGQTNHTDREVCVRQKIRIEQACQAGLPQLNQADQTVYTGAPQVFSRKGQTAVEYLVLLATVAAVTLVSMNSDILDMQETGNIYVDRVTEGLVGQPPECGDRVCGRFETPLKCPIDCTE